MCFESKSVNINIEATTMYHQPCTLCTSQPDSYSELFRISFYLERIKMIFKDRCDSCVSTKFTNEPNCNYPADIDDRILNDGSTFFPANSFEECVTLCEGKPNCMAVGYKDSVNRCFLKENVNSQECGSEISDHSGIRCFEDQECSSAGNSQFKWQIEWQR